ncbi:hypothetical protein [Ruminococcus albus]|uniref:DUF4314 domain-containing protein n=1 Tax=Ruminococcus albus TaxID=1264 RepID=A0A1I1L8F4_RUMAL|nr:hypothetical protein [Ruminococcus albus]SFC65840.1 hypothetical protein SAMN02910406_02126 [Ruminococcus albus]
MMEAITVGAKIMMTASVTSDYPVGSTATIIYIDEMDNVFVEWSDGKLSSFSDKQVLNSFERIGA